MDLSGYSLEQLHAIAGTAPAAPAQDSGPSFFPRLGMQLANFATDIPNDVVMAAGNMVDFVSGAPEWARQQHRSDIMQSAAEARPFDLPPAQNFGGHAADLISGLGRTVAEATMTGAPVTRLSQLLGAGRAAPIIGDIAGGAFIGAQQSAGEALGTGAEFGAIGAANQFIPSPWLKAAANLAVPVGGQLMRGHDITSKESLISTGANVLVPLALGGYARKAERPLMRSEPAPAAQWMEGDKAAPADPNFVMSPRPGSSEAIVAMVKADKPLLRNIADTIKEIPDYANLSEEAKTQALLDAIMQGRVKGGDDVREMLLGLGGGEPTAAPPSMLNRGAAAPEAFTPPAPPVQGGMVRRNPGTMFRAEEGSISPALLQYLGGGAAGAVAGPIIDDDPDKPVWERMAEGAIGGLGLVAAGRGLMRGFDREGRLGMLGVPEGRKWWERPPEPPKEFSPEVYQRLADERWATRSKTTPTTPTTAEAEAIRAAYAEVRAKSDFPAVSIADVLERAGFTPATMDRGRGIVAAMRQKGDVNLSSGDWSASDPRTRSWAVDLYDSSPTNPQPKQLLMRMTDAPAGGGMMRKSGEAGSLDLSSPAFQIGLGGALGGIAGPVVDRDPEHPFAAKVLIGAGLGAGAVGIGRGLMRSGTPAAASTPPAPTTAATAPAPRRGLMQRLQDAADDQERGKPSWMGKTVRAVQRELGLGKTEAQNLAEQQALGERNLFVKGAQPLFNTLRTATDAEKTAISAFEDSARGAADEAALRSAVRPEISKAFFDAEAHEATAQRALADADPTKKPLLDTTEGKWRTRRFSLFNDPDEWMRQQKANPALKQDYVDELMNSNSFPGMAREDVEQGLDQWLAEVQRGGTGYDTPAGSKISSRLFQHRKDLSGTARAFFGEYTNPVQRIAFSLNKLASSIGQAKLISNLVERGAKGELDVMTLEQRRAAIAAARTAGNEARVKELQNLYLVSRDTPGLGKLQGMVVPRAVADSMNLHGQLWEGGWLKGFAPMTNLLKTNMTVMNPGTHGRNWLQMGFLGAVARVHPGDLWSAGRTIGQKGAEWEEMVRNNIVGADFSAAELSSGAKALDTLFNPNTAQKGMDVVRGAIDKVKRFYGMPDNILRAAAYLKQKPRFFAEGNAMGLKGAELERYAQDKATSFVNRYTQNYSMLPNAANIAKNTPFVTPFLSYQFTMGRILKNLAEDAISGSPADRAWAIANLGGLVAMPLIAANLAKSALSDKDAAEWERTQKLSPAFAGGQIRVPLRRKADGSFDYLNIANLVPAGDTAAFLRNLASGDMDKLIAGNPIFGKDKSPVLNTLSEIQSGRESNTNRKFEGTLDLVTHEAAKFLPPIVPPNYEGSRLMRAFQTNDEGGFGVVDSRTGRVETPGSALLRNVGINVAQVQPRQLMRRAQSDLREKESGIKSELRQLLSTNASAETKAAAKRQALMKLKAAREEFRALMR